MTFRVVRQDGNTCHACGGPTSSPSPLAICVSCKREARLGDLVRKLGALTAGVLVFGVSWVLAVVLARVMRP